MIEYIVGQIILNKMDYFTMINLYPEYESNIDELLIEKGYKELIKK